MSREDKKKAKQARIAAGLDRHPGKTPRSAKEVPKAKQPRSLGIDNENAWHRNPVWRFGDIDMGAPPSIGKLGVEDFITLHSKLGDYERQTCSEIWGQHNNGCKRYPVEEAHSNITSRLVEIERDDETALHTLRFGGEYRLYGILREHIFYLLWIDCAHEMWPSEKKNT